MKISNSFRIPAPPDQAWEVLNDVPRVARCAPGAQLLEQRDDGAYVGTVAVKLGPVALSFKGTFSYKEKDPVARRVVAEAAGNEAKARGTARANVVFTLADDPIGTKVDVASDVTLAGSIAQYGRGAALIQSTAQVIIDQFAANLAKEFNAGTPPPPAAEPTPETPMPAQAPAPPPGFTPAPAAKPISMTSVLWQAFLSWLSSLFKKDTKEP
jgi:carbon monoxide dehydrogenase subunit G